MKKKSLLRKNALFSEPYFADPTKLNRVKNALNEIKAHFGVEEGGMTSAAGSKRTASGKGGIISSF